MLWDLYEMTPAEFRRFTRGAVQREKVAWQRTAHVVEVILNTNRKKGSSAKRASQIFPWAFARDPED